jgi:hypothetical protein
MMIEMRPDSSAKLFQWTPQPVAFSFIRTLASDFLAACPEAAAFADRMQKETGTRFIDWIDHFRLNRGDTRAARLMDAGYRMESHFPEYDIYVNSTGVFPPILLWDSSMEAGIKVESIEDFLEANHLQREASGSSFALFRQCSIFNGQDCSMTIVERHGTHRFDGDARDSRLGTRRLLHAEIFRTRPRLFENDEEGFKASHKLIDNAIADLGRDLACDVWFAAEREYWMRRNRAARIQKARQDKLGLGWANHDHHTYRSSRHNFKFLISTWEKFGLYCRERFYAGREAGWGAQVMEQPVAGIVTFNDVDLTPDELFEDFSHEGLADQPRLGTVGLWCGLHGDSFLQSGMHHLEAMFDFDLLTKQLSEQESIKTMNPFTDFPYLRQAFTEGERWPVDPKRIDRLLHAGLINAKQADQFRSSGAIGSHLENLERNDGFKGFNQDGVNAIIAATDPRKHTGA